MNAKILPHLQAIVEQSVNALDKQHGEHQRDRRVYGKRLEEIVFARLRQSTPMKDWYLAVDTPIRQIPMRSDVLLDITVNQYLNNRGIILSMYRDELSSYVGLDVKIGNLRPDLVIMPPGGSIWIWDLTSRECEHLVKTMLYAHVLTALGQHAVISETYWSKMRRKPSSRK